MDARQRRRSPFSFPHRPAGKRLKLAAAAAAALFVAGGAFLGATAQPVIANRAMVETKLNIARTAANAITTLWSYTPENMDSLGDRSAKYLTGDFAFQYRSSSTRSWPPTSRRRSRTPHRCSAPRSNR